MNGFAALPPEGVIRVTEDNYIIIVPRPDGDDVFEKFKDKEIVRLAFVEDDMEGDMLQIFPSGDENPDAPEVTVVE